MVLQQTQGEVEDEYYEAAFHLGGGGGGGAEAFMCEDANIRESQNHTLYPI